MPILKDKSVAFYVTELTAKEKFCLSLVIFLNTDMFKASFCLNHLTGLKNFTVTVALLLSSEKGVMTAMLKKKKLDQLDPAFL